MDAPGRQNFTVADLNTRGELQLRQLYGYQELEQIPGAVDLITLFSTNLYRTPEEFETVLPARGTTFRWRSSSQTAGIATLRWEGRVASVSLLLSGVEAEKDRLTLEIFQRQLLRELHDTGYEPSFALMDLKERPLVATINFTSPPDRAAQMVAALADRCFAAAYFRYHQLA